MSDYKQLLMEVGKAALSIIESSTVSDKEEIIKENLMLRKMLKACMDNLCDITDNKHVCGTDHAFTKKEILKILKELK